MTRRHLLDAARIVFAENGFHGTSIDEVAARAGFTKGAVYSNFKSKDDLFLAVLDDHLEQQMGAIHADLEGGRPPEEEIPRMRDLIVERAWGIDRDDDWGGALYLEYLLYARKNPEAAATLAEGNRRTREAVERLIEEEYGRLGIRPTMPTEALAKISLALFEGLNLLRLVDPSAVTDETLEHALEFMYSVTYPGGERDDPDRRGSR